MIPREYYYSYGNTTVSGVPSSEKNGSRLIRSSKNNRVNNNYGTASADSVGVEDEPKLTTADGYTSAGAPASGSKPIMRSKWGKRSLGKSIVMQEEDAKRAEIIREFSGHCRALRDNPSTHLVDYSER